MKTMINNKVVSPEVYTTINNALDIVHANGEELLKTIDKLTAENEAYSNRLAMNDTIIKQLHNNQILGRCKDCNASSGFEIAGHRWCREIHDNVEFEHYCSWWEEEKTND